MEKKSNTYLSELSLSVLDLRLVPPGDELNSCSEVVASELGGDPEESILKNEQKKSTQTITKLDLGHYSMNGMKKNKESYKEAPFRSPRKISR